MTAHSVNPSAMLSIVTVQPQTCFMQQGQNVHIFPVQCKENIILYKNVKRNKTTSKYDELRREKRTNRVQEDDARDNVKEDDN